MATCLRYLTGAFIQVLAARLRWVIKSEANLFKSSQHYFEQLLQIIPRMPFGLVDRASQLLFHAYEARRTIFTFGNGGSASLATHMACDLGKGTSSPEISQRVRVIALTDNIPLLTAWANDSSYDDIFAEQLRNLGRSGDIALAISGSGNSPNVLKGLQAARQLGMITMGIGGFGGGRMKALCDLSVIVPSDNMQFVEDLHLSIAHCIFSLLKQKIYAASAIKPSVVAVAATGAGTHQV
jgi:D-sedoheptulose 7-phosphate isomerase